MDKVDKIKFWMSLIFRLLLVGVIIISIFSKDWMNLFLAIATMFLTFAPSMLEKKFRIDYPGEFEILILVFLYASLFLGEINKFYQIYWWWDLMLHSISGVIIGIFAFSLVYLVSNEKKVKIKLNPLFIAIFSLCFAISVGVIWEIFEFSADAIFRTTMQLGHGDALVDTMWDLIADTLGALLVSILGYFYIKGNFRGPLSFMKIYETKFSQQNPHIFNKHLKRTKPKK